MTRGRSGSTKAVTGAGERASESMNTLRCKCLCQLDDSCAQINSALFVLDSCVVTLFVGLGPACQTGERFSRQSRSVIFQLNAGHHLKCWDDVSGGSHALLSRCSLARLTKVVSLHSVALAHMYKWALSRIVAHAHLSRTWLNDDMCRRAWSSSSESCYHVRVTIR